MSVSNTTSKAGPYSCNGAQVTFAFAFKAFSKNDLRVVLTDPSAVESDLTVDSQFTVALNADQNASPGGSITTLATYAAGYLTTIVSNQTPTQGVSITNFRPDVIEKAFDKLTLLVQQLFEQASRAVALPVSSSISVTAFVASLFAAETNAASSASAAATSATSAGNSATAAAASATSATTKAGLASTSETNAAASAAAALSSKNAAATSETNAATSASTATTKASQASTSATNAATSETNAATSETNAATSAASALSSKNAAATSETNAAASAAAAAASAASMTPIEQQIHSAASKATPVDADELGIADSAAAFGVKKLTWANLKATLLSTWKDATGGLVGMTLFKINFKNAANTFTSFLTNSNTAARTYTFQDRDGTIADNTDLASKAPLASPTFTGTPAAPTAAPGTNTTQLATTAFVLANSKIAQVVKTETGAVASGSTAIPADDTIPQNTEGDQYMSLAITPTNASSTLIIAVTVVLAHVTVGMRETVALFQDATAGALAAVMGTVASNSQTQTISFIHTMAAGTTSATTFKVRAGGSTGATTTFNGAAAARLLGGVMASSIVITEVLP